MPGAARLIGHCVAVVRSGAESVIRSAGADGMIVAELTTTVEKERCEMFGYDFTCDVSFTGTSIARAPKVEAENAGMLTIMRLDR